MLFVACYLSMGFDNKLMLFYAMVVIGVILIVVDSIDFQNPSNTINSISNGCNNVSGFLLIRHFIKRYMEVLLAYFLALLH